MGMQNKRLLASGAADVVVSDATLDDRQIIPLTYVNLFWIFVVASFFGLIVETAVSYPIDGVWKNRAGFLWGPFSPIYGVGAVLMTLLLNRSKAWSSLRVFVVAALAGGAFELFAGWFWKNAFGIVAWSYIDRPFNIGGYTCLEISLMWGALGFVWARVILPQVSGVMEHVAGTRLLLVLTVLGTGFMLADTVVTFGALGCWFERQVGMPVETQLQAFFASRYPDEFMSARFQTMTIYPQLATFGIFVK